MLKFKPGDTVIILNSKIPSILTIGGEYMAQHEKVKPCIVLDEVPSGALLVSTLSGIRAVINPVYLALNPVEVDNLITLRRNRLEYRIEKLEETLLKEAASPKAKNKNKSVDMPTLQEVRDEMGSIMWHSYQFSVEGVHYDIILELQRGKEALGLAQLILGNREVTYNARDFANALGALCYEGQEKAILDGTGIDALVAIREGVRFDDEGELLLTWEGVFKVLEHFAHCKKLVKKALKNA